jgi:hypothetical protein
VIECRSRTGTEVAFAEMMEGKLEHLRVRIDSFHHNEATGVLDVTLALPQWADRHLRHEVLHKLAMFEAEHEGVITNPAFTASLTDS